MRIIECVYREKETELASKFDNLDYPAVVLLRQNRVYEYPFLNNQDNDINMIDEILEFANEGYLDVKDTRFGVPNNILWRISRILSMISGGFEEMIDYIGLDFVPYWVKISLPLMILFSPFIIIAIGLLLSDKAESNVNKEDKKKTTASKRAARDS